MPTIRAALEAAGVVFLDGDDVDQRVRLRRHKEVGVDGDTTMGSG